MEKVSKVDYLQHVGVQIGQRLTSLSDSLTRKVKWIMRVYTVVH